MSVLKSVFTHRSLDGFPLSVTRFLPPTPPVAKCIFVCATGVQARFYNTFAEHLSTLGVAAHTFDYRYSGNSFPLDLSAIDVYKDADSYTEALRRCPTEVDLTNTWGRTDLASMVDMVYGEYPGIPLVLVGHSLGGHLMALLGPKQKAKVSRYLAVCCGNAYLGNTKHAERALKAFREIIQEPMMEAGPSKGTFKASIVGMGFDLPYGPGVEWLRWAFHPYHSMNLPEDHHRGRAIQGVPYLYVGFSDDASVDKHMSYEYLRCLSHADGLKRSLWINPLKRTPIWDSCGHINFFNRSKKPLSPGIQHGEMYEPNEHAKQKEATVLTHEESIWKLLSGYILNGEIDAGDDELKVWKVEDERELVEDFERRKVEEGELKERL